MNSTYFSYFRFEKSVIQPSEISNVIVGYDRFISTANASQRVKEVFSKVEAKEKHWLNVLEYNLIEDDFPEGDTRIVFNSFNEADVILDYFEAHPLQKGERICIDSTGFVRPHLLFLLRYLFERGVKCADILYSEPIKYVKGSGTRFSAAVKQVRQVFGFEGSHNAETDGEFLIVGCGYDTDLMAAVAQNRYQATKLQMFPFPALRPHMYQENRLKTETCQAAFGNVLEQFFAPAYDPFATAQALSRFYAEHHLSIKNLYLSPLATKAQVLGFGLFYLAECLDRPVSVLFPFSEGYNRETSVGISELWRYSIDFDLVREISLSS